MLTAAQNMAQAFSSTAANLVSQQRSADSTVTQSVSQINSLTAQIAQLNGEVSNATSTGQNPGTFVDQRDQLINQLSGLIDVSEIPAGNGSLTLTTTGGANLVVGNQSFQLTTQADPATGFQQVLSQGSNITARSREARSGGAIAGPRHGHPCGPFLARLAGREPGELLQLRQPGRHRPQRQSGRKFLRAAAGGRHRGGRCR